MGEEGGVEWAASDPGDLSYVVQDLAFMTSPQSSLRIVGGYIHMFAPESVGGRAVCGVWQGPVRTSAAPLWAWPQEPE